MARRARQTGLNSKVYRHFAVITVCLTATLAIFADGENRSAMAEELDARDEHTALKQEEAEKYGKPRLIATSHDRPRNTGGGFDADGGGEFGAPMDDLGSDQGSGYVPPSRATTQVGLGIDYAALGLTQAQFEALSQAERDALLQQLRAQRTRQARSLLERSAARGGVEL
ncbi:hypothetical protein [Pelagerythrobacter marensis]|uniref:Uncharacterized protein n=1 Tax=Pelagerythrobacter marensis TaxID=543877 RepID=A0A0G3X9U3_9SPHN|nr:hypothetical protein [Pelagerythrobacter marensis]AKM07113.1 hypothetical protein AM2010_1038 [Pelagerythrobacter marensis]